MRLWFNICNIFVKNRLILYMSNRLLNTIGIITLIASVAYLIKQINKQTETRLISDEAFDALQDRDNIEELDKIVADYHKTGKWDKTRLQNIN